MNRNNIIGEVSMDNKEIHIEKLQKIKSFVRGFLKLIFVKCDLNKIALLMEKEATFVGINTDYRDVFFERLSSISNIIINDDYDIRSIGNEIYLVQGKFDNNQNSDKYISSEPKIFSLICTEKNDSFLINHCHFSGFGEGIIGTKNENEENWIKVLDSREDIIKTLTDNICGGVQICSYDEGFDIKYISEGFTRMLGYTMEELWEEQGGKHINLVYKEDKEILLKSIKEQLEISDNFVLEYRVVHKNGSIVHVIDKGKLISGPNNTLDLQCILTDVTDNKIREEELSLSKKRYEVALKFSEISMFEYDFKTKNLNLFDNINAMYDVPEIIEDGVNTFVKTGIIDAEYANEYKAMYKAVENGAKEASCLIKTRDKCGDYHDYELSLTAVFGKDGKVEKAIGVRRNITDIRRLNKEREFAKRFTENKEFIMEININKNRFEYLIQDWQEFVKKADEANYSKGIREYIEYHVAPEHRDQINKNLNLDYIKNQGKLGNYAYNFIYKRKDKGGVHYKWYESTVSIVKDELTGDLVARIHREDINDRKEKELKAQEEQRRYRHMVDKCDYAFEINYTKDIMYKGHEHWYKRNGKNMTVSYTQVIKDFAAINLSKEDGEKFVEAVQREKMIALFERGERFFLYECNEIFENGDSRWLECTLYFYEDVDNGDIRCFAYMNDMNDINDKKCKEIRLKFEAEHDAMTGMYNKVKAEEKIDELLQKSVDEILDVLIVVDIDYFKSVNDNFGHVFGDEVIKDISSIIFTAFRKSDIIGRIGGDEFCIFMRGATSMAVIERKAQELCSMLCKTYSKDNVEVKISASVGLAIAGIHGKTYHELYINADSALYIAKNSGKNKYQISN